MSELIIYRIVNKATWEETRVVALASESTWDAICAAGRRWPEFGWDQHIDGPYPEDGKVPAFPLAGMYGGAAQPPTVKLSRLATPGAQAVLDRRIAAQKERRRLAARARRAVREAAAYLDDEVPEAYEAWRAAADLDDRLRPEVGEQETEASHRAFIARREAASAYAATLERAGRTLAPWVGGEIAYRTM